MPLTALAPAKVNLFLHVGPVQSDGYHPLASLVTFADVGDLISVEPAARLSLEVTGPFASALGPDDDNLILKALRALGRKAGIGDPAVRVVLDKRLPVAAGLGGGSSDAGTALRLTRRLLNLDIDDAALEAVAEVVGADGAMCVRATTALAEGRGDRLIDVADFPALHAVLFNPGVPSPTGAVYRAYDDAPPRAADMPSMPSAVTPGAVVAWLSAQRNDLQGPAIALEPAIGLALQAMAATCEVRLVRMSGSGATVFGLFDSAAAARAATRDLSGQYGGGWAVTCVLGGQVSNSSE